MALIKEVIDHLEQFREELVDHFYSVTIAMVVSPRNAEYIVECVRLLLITHHQAMQLSLDNDKYRTKSLSSLATFYAKHAAPCRNSVCGIYHIFKPADCWKLHAQTHPSKSSVLPIFKMMKELYGLPTFCATKQTLRNLNFTFVAFHLRKFFLYCGDNRTGTHCEC
jgi:hypothetical protein